MVYKSKQNLPLSPDIPFSCKSNKGKERWDSFVNTGIKFPCPNKFHRIQGSMGHLNPIVHAEWYVNRSIPPMPSNVRLLPSNTQHTSVTATATIWK
jgi:hypothetical protein